MKNKIFILALSSIFLSTVSCNDYLDVNESPDAIAIDQVTPNFIFPGAVSSTHFIQARRLNAFAGITMNSYAGNVYSFGTPFVDEYAPNVTTAFYADIWDQMFRSLGNFQAILDYNDPTGQYTQYKAMSMIMKAYYVQTLTDLWGDMPYTEAFKRQLLLTPKYDKGEDIYKASIADLETAIQLIDGKQGSNPGAADIVFKGTMANWTAFANAVKLRYLVRMSNVTGELATYRTQKLATLQGAAFPAADVVVNPGYSSASDSKQNPFTNYFVVLSSGSRPTTGNQGFNLYVPSEHIALALNGNKKTLNGTDVSDSRDVYQKFNNIVDGRGGRIFTLINGKVEGVRQGASPGQAGAETGRTVSRLGTGLILGSNATAVTVAAASSKSGVLMSKAETEFLLAEAALRYPANISGTAQSHFESGITASYTYLGATGSAAYITSINAVPKLGWAGSDANKVEAIMTQKWIALTGINPEQSYFDYTRTGFPITPVPVSSTQPLKPNRLIYPASEYAANGANVPNMTAADVFAKNSFTPFWAR